MIYLLIDSRRKLSVDDQSFLDFVKYYELPVTVIFTKADKQQSLEPERYGLWAKIYGESWRYFY